MTILTNTEYTVGADTYSEGTTKGYIMAGVRNDVLATLVGEDNEMGPLQVNSVGALYTNPSGLRSSNNSSTSTLSADGIFTGTSDDVTNFSSITVNIFADVPSSSTGVSFQFSSNSSNWDIKYEHNTIANEEKIFELPINAQYFRVVFTNGTIAQSTFRLQTIYHSTKSSTGHLLGTDTYDNKTVRGNIIGGVRTDTHTSLVDNNNEMAPIQLNSMGELKVDSTEMRKIRELLQDILVELKINNLHNNILTEECYDKDSVEED